MKQKLWLTLVTCLAYGILATIVSVVLNIIVVGLLLRSASLFMRLIGDAGAKALSKVMSLLLGAIAIMLIRRGIQMVIASGS